MVGVRLALRTLLPLLPLLSVLPVLAAGQRRRPGSAG
jgi:hypothetical protein